ncbi:MAG: hypothetical protein OET90_09335, partial [Desulfuromonadales bacterium]|nr:hypothetical protein [Desulfuromonadales bacterium]
MQSLKKLAVVALCALFAVTLASVAPVFAADSGTFFFTVFGDNRLPGYMNFTQDQQAPGGPIDNYLQANFNNSIDAFELNFVQGKLV